MPTRSEKVARFRALHARGCFIMPNPWDIAGAKLLAGLGFPALASTSSGFAHSIGSHDGAGGITRDMTLAHAAALAAAVEVPVNADTEDCYGETPAAAAETVRLAAEAGLSGLSIEDSSPRGSRSARGRADAEERVGAAAEMARRHGIVLTARADGLLMGWYDLDEAIARLRAFAKLGADVVYAPGIRTFADLIRVCASADAPFNHLAAPGIAGARFEDIAKSGVRRISTGGGLAKAVGGAMLKIAEDIKGGDFAALETAPPWDKLRG